MKRMNIKCPYCGSLAYLRPASVVHGDRAVPGMKLYVCARYPACDAYVTAHRSSLIPMGTLAGPELRRKRQLAHAAFNRLWESGLMTKKQAYLWLQAKLDLPESEAHIARFSEWRCQQVIDLCASFGHSSNHAA